MKESGNLAGLQRAHETWLAAASSRARTHMVPKMHFIRLKLWNGIAL
jgi:hypothetical protein